MKVMTKTQKTITMTQDEVKLLLGKFVGKKQGKTVDTVEVVNGDFVFTLEADTATVDEDAP